MGVRRCHTAEPPAPEQVEVRGGGLVAPGTTFGPPVPLTGDCRPADGW